MPRGPHDVLFIWHPFSLARPRPSPRPILAPRRPPRVAASAAEAGEGERAYENLLGVHGLVFSGQWDVPGAQRAISGARDAGFDLVEIPILRPNIDRAATRELLAQYGIRATCSLGLKRETDISSEDPDTVKKGEEALMVALETAADVGSKFLGGVLYSMLGKYEGPATEKGVENCVNVLRRVCERAKELGLVVGLEPCNRYETNVANTAKDTMRLIERIGNPDNCVVHLDTYHMHTEEVYEDAITNAGSRAGYVHIGDSQRGYLGSGNVDFKRIFGALARAGYKGPLVFESFSNQIVGSTLTTSLAIWREMWTDSDHLARHARRFVDKEWREALKCVEKENMWAA